MFGWFGGRGDVIRDPEEIRLADAGDVGCFVEELCMVSVWWDSEQDGGETYDFSLVALRKADDEGVRKVRVRINILAAGEILCLLA